MRAPCSSNVPVASDTASSTSSGRATATKARVTSGQNVEPLAQQVEQRDGRELADPLPITRQARGDRLDLAVGQRDTEADRADRDTILFRRSGDAGHRDTHIRVQHATRAL